MANKTLPTLSPTSSIATDTLFLVRRNGQIEDEKTTGADLQTFFFTNPAITGGTINNTVIGGTTPAAGSFTTLVATTIDTGQGAVECYAMNQAVRTTDAVTFASLTLTTALAVAQGGTGATTAANARTNLGLVIGTNVQAYDAGLQSISGLTTLADRSIYTTASDTYAVYTLTAGGRALAAAAGTANTFPYFSATNTVTLGAITAAGLALLDDADASAQRTTLGLAIGTNVQAYDAGLQSIAALATAADTMIYTTAPDTYTTTTLTAFGRSLIDDTTAANARTTLGLGTISTQDAATVAITGGTITGITDLAVADGGTGASNAAGARTNLGLGTISTQDANNVSISGGSVTGIADISIADGGTGASTAANARTNLGLVIGTDVQSYNVNTLTQYFESTNQVITTAGLITVAHGFSRIPRVIQPYIVCTTAANGYSVNDETLAPVSHHYDSAVASGGTAVYADATNIYIRCGGSGFSILDKATGLRANITLTSYRMKVRAYA